MNKNNIGDPRSVKSFKEAQVLSAYRLGFSVTKACPLRCSHCSVSAAPELGHTTFPRDFGYKVARQIPKLREIGIKFIDFTGGEPTLAREFIQIVSSIAKKNEIQTGITTAAHWATNEANAQKYVTRFKHIDNWDISTDVYHLPFVPLENVKLAHGVLTKNGKPPIIRVAYHEPLTLEDAQLIDTVHKFAGQRMGFQPVGPVGRAAEWFDYPPVTENEWDRTPCPSTGPLVQSSGQVAPCCAPLSHEEYDHPLLLGNAFDEPLDQIVMRWRTNPLLQTIRVWGFRPVVRWLTESKCTQKHIFRHRVCHQCVQLIRDRELCDFVMQKASAFSHRIKLAYALIKEYDEHWLDDDLRREAQTLLEND